MSNEVKKRFKFESFQVENENNEKYLHFSIIFDSTIYHSPVLGEKSLEGLFRIDDDKNGKPMILVSIDTYGNNRLSVIVSKYWSEIESELRLYVVINHSDLVPKCELTHNEYEEYVKRCANRLVSEKDYTVLRFNNDLAKITLIPFNTERYIELDKHSKKWINQIFSKSIETDNSIALKGFIGHPLVLANKLGLNLLYFDGFAGLFVNPENRFIFEYCEGDIILTIYKFGHFEHAVKETVRWYEKEYDTKINEEVLL